MKKRRRANQVKSMPARRNWRERLRESQVPLVVSGLALVVYSRSLFCGFIRDDIPQIVHNPQVQSWQYLPEILTSHLWSHVVGHRALFYRPLFSLWMLVIDTLGGLSPWFWHLSSMLLHVAFTYLVYRLTMRLIGGNAVAGVAAALFAVHPIHVDAVTWISASNELLFSLLTLGAMLVLLTSDDRGRRGPIFLSALLYFLGLFAKETGAAMIVVLVVMAWSRTKDRETSWHGRLTLAGGPYVAATAVYLTIRWLVIHGTELNRGNHSWREVIFSSPSIMLFYLRKLIIPVGLSGGYVNPIYSSPTIAFWLPLVAILLFVFLMAWLALRINSLFGFSAALIFLPLLPALAGIRLYPQGDMTHDRYLYLPSVGLCLLIGLLVERMLKAPINLRKVAGSVLAIVLFAFSGLTFAQQRFYYDDVAYPLREISVNPANSFAYDLLGNVYMDQGRTDLALKNYRIASELAPNDVNIGLHLARGLFVLQNYAEAKTVLNPMMLRTDLDANMQTSIRLSLANVEIGLGNLGSAQQLLQQVEQADPNFPELHWGLGVLYHKQGRIQLAEAEFEKEYRLTGDQEAQRQSAMLTMQMLQTPPSNGSRY
jgi:tetratricopeptide (TPR) repeat protein